MTFKQRFHFTNGEILELGDVQEKLNIDVFNGVLTVNGPTTHIINLDKIVFIQITKESK